MNSTYKKVIPLLVVFTVLLTSNFIDAAWDAPGGIPSALNNADAPINVSLTNQLKKGDITARNVKAGGQMWSAEYCDETGGNCFSSATSTSVGDEVVVGGICFRPRLAAKCTWNWAGTGNDTVLSPSGVCEPGRVKTGSLMLLSQCNMYEWKVTVGACSATPPPTCGSNSGTKPKQVTCIDIETGGTVPDSNCLAVPKPSSAPVACSASNNNCTCFTAGTDVTMADGTQKNIEDVVIGESVLGQNGSINEVLGYDRPMLGERLLYSFNNGPFFVTAEHPFMTNDGWKSVSVEAFHAENPSLAAELEVTTLEVGDAILRSDGTFETINSIESQSETDQRLYNFRLDGDSTYTADGYVTHNK